MRCGSARTPSPRPRSGGRGCSAPVPCAAEGWRRDARGARAGRQAAVRGWRRRARTRLRRGCARGDCAGRALPAEAAAGFRGPQVRRPSARHTTAPLRTAADSLYCSLAAARRALKDAPSCPHELRMFAGRRLIPVLAGRVIEPLSGDVTREALVLTSCHFVLRRSRCVTRCLLTTRPHLPLHAGGWRCAQPCSCRSGCDCVCERKCTRGLIHDST